MNKKKYGLKKIVLFLVMVIAVTITFFRVDKVKAYYQKIINKSVDFTTADYSNLTFTLDKSIYASCDNNSIINFTVNNSNDYDVSYSLSFSNNTPTYTIDGVAGATYVVSANTSRTNTIAITGATGTSITVTVNVLLPYSTTHTQVINFDNTCPTVSLSPNTSGTYVKSANVVVSVSDNQLKSNQSIKYRWQDNDSCSTTASDYTSIALPSTNSVTVNANGLNGTYYLCIYGGIQDVAGNSSVGVTSGAFYFDNIAPTISLPTDEPVYVYKYDSEGFTSLGSASDTGGSGLASFVGSVNGETLLSNVPLGAQTVSYVATDGAGNSTSATLSIIVYAKIDCELSGISADPTDSSRCIFRGSNPNNWIRFNGTYTSADDLNPTGGYLYRIIGNEEVYTTTTEKRYAGKIVHATDLGSTRTFGSGTNRAYYFGSALRTYLVGTYASNFNTYANNHLQPAIFYDGGNVTTTNTITISSTITTERNKVGTGTSKVGLPNVYDYLLASTNCNGSTTWETIKAKTCDSNNWMVYTTANRYTWFVSHTSATNVAQWLSPGYSTYATYGPVNGTGATNEAQVRPVVYLNNNVIIIGGTGTESDPYLLAADKFIGTALNVTFNANGGTVSPTSKTVRTGNIYGELPIPTKVGYNFLGWSTTPNQQLDYIASTGTQYIDTGYQADKNLGIEVVYQFDDLAVQQRLFGGTANGNVSYGFYINGSGNWAYSFNNDSGNFVSLVIAANKSKHTLKFNRSNKVTLDSSYDSTISGTVSKTSEYGLTIFADHGNGTPRLFAKTRVYSFKMYNGSTLVRDYVPMYRGTDGAIGLYDNVNNVFYANAGTGKFTKGSYVNAFITSSTEVIANSDHTLYAIWEKSIPSCTITTPSGYDTSKVLTINATSAIPLDANPYSWDNSTWSSTNTREVSAAATYRAYVKDEDGEVGTCTLQIKSRTEWAARNCTGTVSYGQWTQSGSGYLSGTCQAWTYETSKRECNSSYNQTGSCTANGGGTIYPSGTYTSLSACQSGCNIFLGTQCSTELGGTCTCQQQYTNFTRSCSCSAWGAYGAWGTTEPSTSCSVSKTSRTTYGT